MPTCGSVDSRLLRSQLLSPSKVAIKLDSASFFFYDFRLRELGDTVWSIYSNDDSEIYVENLKLNKQYEYQVRVYCSSRSNGGWSGSAFFNTESTTAFTNSDKLKIKVYPVPASNILNLQFEEEESKNTNYEILDAFGKTILHGIFRQSYQRLDVSIWRDGMYFIKIYTPRGLQIIKCLILR